MDFRKMLAAVAIGIVFCAGCATMQGSWQKASSEDTLSAYEEFLKTYPEGEFTAQAKKSIAEISYKEAKETDTVTAYEDFLKKFPDSTFLNEVNKRIEYLRTAESEFMQVNKNSIVELESFLKKYKTGRVVLQAKEAVENIKIEEIQKQGVGSRFHISEILPQGNVGAECSFTIIGSDSDPTLVLVSTEYPKDISIYPFRFDALKAGSVLRFKKKVFREGYTFEGDENEPLSFILLPEFGLVYLTGKGKVTLKDGKTITLPTKE